MTRDDYARADELAALYERTAREARPGSVVFSDPADSRRSRTTRRNPSP